MPTVIGQRRPNIGVAMGPMTTAALGTVAVDEAGVASGVVTTSRQVGGALGIAPMGAIVAAAERSRAATRAPLQFVAGFQHASGTGAAIALAGAVVSAVLVKPTAAARGRPSRSRHARAVRS
jgi:hypothetical protein